MKEAFQKIYQVINALEPITDEAWDVLVPLFELKSFKNKEYLI